MTNILLGRSREMTRIADRTAIATVAANYYVILRVETLLRSARERRVLFTHLLTLMTPS